ncbi:MAG: CDP-alcohol phosphatidyltransferase family protein [bacterium]|nr:CDP-alcohol phosphatidyltransferase family protein [bacterium]
MARESVPPIDELRPIAQPSSVTNRRSAEHWTGHLYMRRISIYGTRLALQLGFSADFVTGVMIVVGLIAVATTSVPGLWSAVVGALLIQLYLGLDCVDGEVARVRRTESARGVYLDRLGHYLVEGGLLIALGIRASDGGLESVVLGLIAAIGVLLEKAETDLVTVARSSQGKGAAGDAAASIKQPTLARGRQLARLLPIHMATHAAEASLLIVVAAIADEIRGDLLVSRILLVALAAITAAMVVLHLISILNSKRFD